MKLATSITAQNGTTTPVKIAGDGIVVLVTGGTNAAGAIFVIQLESVSGQWDTVGLFDAASGARAASLTGPNKRGWTEAYGALRARAKRTDATAGVGEAAVASV